jgi:hypothetical protein
MSLLNCVCAVVTVNEIIVCLLNASLFPQGPSRPNARNMQNEKNQFINRAFKWTACIEFSQLQITRQPNLIANFQATVKTVKRASVKLCVLETVVNFTETFCFTGSV